MRIDEITNSKQKTKVQKPLTQHQTFMMLYLLLLWKWKELENSIKSIQIH